MEEMDNHRRLGKRNVNRVKKGFFGILELLFPELPLQVHTTQASYLEPGSFFCLSGGRYVCT